MELSYDELNKLLLCIFTRSSVCNLEKNKQNVDIVFKYPTNDIQLKADHIYDMAYKKAVDQGLMPLADIEKLIRDKGIYTEEDENKISKLESQLFAQKTLLAKTTKVKANMDRINKVIKGLEDQVLDIKYKRLSKITMSAETKAEEDKHTYLCWACSFDFYSDHLYWPTYNDLMLEKDLNFRNTVLSNFLKFYIGLSQSIIRSIARSNLWRARYISSQKTGDILFGIPVVDYSNDQFNLVYWSGYYQNIYEMFPDDRPDDLTIDDDDALDSYMEKYYDKKTKEDAARRAKSKVKGSLSAFDKEEVIVTKAHELYQDLEYDKPREARRYKDQVEAKIKTKKRR